MRRRVCIFSRHIITIRTSMQIHQKTCHDSSRTEYPARGAWLTFKDSTPQVGPTLSEHKKESQHDITTPKCREENESSIHPRGVISLHLVPELHICS